MYHYTESGLRGIWLANGYKEVETSEGKGVAFANLEGLHRAIAMDLLRYKPRLSGKEFRFIRQEMRFSQARLAQMLGTTDQAVARWEKGKTRVPKMADRFLRAFYRESAEGNAHIIEMVKRLNEIDQQAWEKRTYGLENNEWRVAA
ncbi:MAG TPA: helix-turn-helix domain-containing protein [Rhodospirillaceae bacterium]|jgi:DNA-binding transcriptional regulator YiaG|nr:helix-turn-helix domain-containing protein [Rhodospirillales bacterium]MDP7216162.1 helix-turn-helix domain-containing protein [Rhodospirillales bacterium]HIJ43505.1 helix-turn-helix domain-containing protein [Rhodospirillaceae bacterium]HIJ45723.1 helix-turn-helix domain-containing protein [Rhodospirillaceae bacterium]HIJ93555.1 helix-turn-helix domain-containing protein [Rhodospirillaceae bacterium]